MTVRQEHQSLYEKITAFLARHQIAESHFCRNMVRNGRLMERMRDSGRVWPDTETHIIDTMRQYDVDHGFDPDNLPEPREGCT